MKETKKLRNWWCLSVIPGSVNIYPTGNVDKMWWKYNNFSYSYRLDVCAPKTKRKIKKLWNSISDYVSLTDVWENANGVEHTIDIY